MTNVTPLKREMPTTEPAKPKRARKPRAKKVEMNVDNVMAMVALRDHMKARTAERRAFEKANAPWRRIAAKLATLAVVAAITFVVIAHAMAS
jgi:hypothetical protein